MSRVPQWTLLVGILFGLLACQGDEAGMERGRRAQMLGDSIERGYQRLREAYGAVPDSLSPELRDMYGAMGEMRGMMQQRHGQGMGQMGMRGQEMMRARNRQGQMREWHQQMMAMHAEMAQVHGQRGHTEVAGWHEKLRQQHRRMMESFESDADTGGTAPEDVVEGAAVDGARVYRQQCATCHGRSGQGFGTFPPLAGSAWVTGDEDIPIRILLNGLQGSIEVQDRSYNGIMPAFGSRLRDEEVAALLTFVRSSWGNDAESVEVKAVREVRAQYGQRTRPWTTPDLQE